MSHIQPTFVSSSPVVAEVPSTASSFAAAGDGKTKNSLSSLLPAKIYSLMSISVTFLPSLGAMLFSKLQNNIHNQTATLFPQASKAAPDVSFATEQQVLNTAKAQYAKLSPVLTAMAKLPLFPFGNDDVRTLMFAIKTKNFSLMEKTSQHIIENMSDPHYQPDLLSNEKEKKNLYILLGTATSLLTIKKDLAALSQSLPTNSGDEKNDELTQLYKELRIFNDEVNTGYEEPQTLDTIKAHYQQLMPTFTELAKMPLAASSTDAVNTLMFAIKMRNFPLLETKLNEIIQGMQQPDYRLDLLSHDTGRKQMYGLLELAVRVRTIKNQIDLLSNTQHTTKLSEKEASLAQSQTELEAFSAEFYTVNDISAEDSWAELAKAFSR